MPSISEKSSPGDTPWMYMFSATLTTSRLPVRSPLPKQAAFEAVGTSHQRELGRRRARAAIVVGMDGQHDGITALDVAVRPLHHVGKQIGRGMLHRGGQVDDALALGRGLPYIGDGIDDALGKLQLGIRIHLGRVLEGPLRLGVAGSDLVEHAGIGGGQLDDLVFAHVQHHAAHHGRGGVCTDGTMARGHAFERFEGTADEVLARLGQHLDGHVIGNAVFPR